MAEQPTSAPKAAVSTEKHETAIRWALVAAGVAVFALTLVLLFIERQTSEVKVTPQASPATSATTATATDTVTKSSLSDAVILGFLGLGAVLLVTGAFFGRITKVTLPGGVEVDMSAELQAAENAVTGGPTPKASEPGAVAAIESVGPPPLSPSETAQAILHTAAFAAQLKRLATTSPGQLWSVGMMIGMSLQEIHNLQRNGSLDPSTWTLLANKARDQAKATPT